MPINPFLLRAKSVTCYSVVCCVTLTLTACGYSTLENEKRIEQNYQSETITNPSSVTCAFEYVSEVSQESGKMIYKYPMKQSQPILFHFFLLDTDHPIQRGIGVDGSAYESNPIILARTADKIVLAELTSQEKNIFIYSIHLDSGAATWTKQYQWPPLSTAIGSLALGKCW